MRHHSWSKNDANSLVKPSCPCNCCQKLPILTSPFTTALSEFSAGCAGRTRHLLWQADSSQCLCGIGDITDKPCTCKQRVFDRDVTHSQSTLSNVQGVLGIKAPWNHTKGTWPWNGNVWAQAPWAGSNSDCIYHPMHGWSQQNRATDTHSCFGTELDRVELGMSMGRSAKWVAWLGLLVVMMLIAIVCLVCRWGKGGGQEMAVG